MPSSKILTIQSLAIQPSIKSAYDYAALVFCSRYVRDRFNVLNQYSEVDWADKVDTVPIASDKPIEDIMDERATELIKQGSIAVQWSGGVDSTALVLSLIKNGISKEDLVICYDWNSVEEYPKLFSWFQENGWNIKRCSDWFAELSVIDTDLITNGWCADQLFGSVFFHRNPQYYDYQIADFMKQTNPNFSPLTDEQIAEFTEIYKKYAQEYFGLQLDTAAQLGWFVNFVMKWTWVSRFNALWLVQTDNKNKTQVFYDTPEFQSWSLGNYESIADHNIYGEDPQYYKRPLKEYCNSIFPDEYFLKNKTKRPSWNSANNHSMYVRRKICLETTEGFVVHNLESITVPTQWDEALQTIFTSIKK